jgi:hypothetical protein
VDTGSTIYLYSAYIGDERTRTEAMYESILYGLASAKNIFNVRHVLVLIEMEDVVNQIRGITKTTKNNLQFFRTFVVASMSRFDSFNVLYEAGLHMKPLFELSSKATIAYQKRMRLYPSEAQNVDTLLVNIADHDME